MKDLTASLTLTGSVSSLAAVLALIGSGGAAIPLTGGITPADDGDDDGAGVPGGVVPNTDSTGLPHDERIHSKNPTLNQDGTWKKRRGVQEATITAVEAELRARVGAPVPPPVAPAPFTPPVMPPAATIPPVTPPMPVPPVTPPPVPMPPQAITPPPMAPMPVLPPVPPQPVAPPPVAATIPPVPNPEPQPTAQAQASYDFPAFMAILTAGTSQLDPATNTPRISTEYLAQITAEIATAFGVTMTNITEIMPNPQMINYAVALLNRDGKM